MQQEIYQHFSSLRTSFLEIFQGEIPSHVLESYPGEKRARLHYTARLALIKSIQDKNFEDYKDLDIENHQFMKNDQQIKVSLSHADHKAMATTTTDSLILSIGVDLEREDREIKKGIKKFYIIDNDELDSPLELWCVKEAAFKAISPLYKGDKKLVLKDITVKKSGAFTLELNPNLNGHWKLERKSAEIHAYAIILKNS